MPFSQPSIRAGVLADYREFLCRRNIDVNGLLTRAGIVPASLETPDAELPLNAVALLMELAAEAAGDPCLALRYAEVLRIGASGVLGYLVSHARTVREALEALERYVDIVARPVEMRLAEEGAVARLSWFTPWNLTVPREQLSVFIVALLVLRIRHVAGSDWRPRLVEMDHRAPACASKLVRLIRSKVCYDRSVSTIVLDLSTLERRGEGADPHLYPILQLAGDAKRQELGDGGDLVTRTIQTITGQLSGGPPYLERVAKQMRISPRSLQNRLARGGTSFEKIVAETRRSLAQRYLCDTELPITEIAFRLGFSELSAFTRAARGWFGIPPREVRARGWPVECSRGTDHGPALNDGLRPRSLAHARRSRGV